MGLLVERTWGVPGNWYEPLNKILEYPSVVHGDYAEMCSSAGDWTGLFFQKIGDRTYAIPFMQENNYPRGAGFILYTGKVFASFLGELTKELEESIFQRFFNFYYT